MYTTLHFLSRVHGGLSLQAVVKHDILEPQHIVKPVFSPQGVFICVGWIELAVLNWWCTVFCRSPGVLDVCEFKEKEKDELMTYIKHRLTPHPVKISAGVCVCVCVCVCGWVGG